MNYCQICELDVPALNPHLQKQYSNIKKLFLSHNHLQSLKGIEHFNNLTHISVSYNKLQHIEEFARVKNPHKVECLAVKGNLLIERHPDYRTLLIEYFPSLKELDSVNLATVNPCSSQGQRDGPKQQVRHGRSLKREIIPFIYRIDKIIQNLAQDVEAARSARSGDTDLRAQERLVVELKQKFDIINQLKDLKSFGKVSPKLLLSHLQIINEQLIEKYKNEYRFMPESRDELYFLYKWLFQEILITLSSPGQMRNNELSKYLNQTILTKNPDLFNFLKTKHDIKDAANDLQRQLERVIAIMQDDDQINFDVLINEQLQEFYKSQPQQSTLSDQFYIIEKQTTERPGVGEANPMQKFPDFRVENKKELSFGNQQTLWQYSQRDNGFKGSDQDFEGQIDEEGLEKPREQGEVPTPAEAMKEDDLKEIIGGARLNPFRIRNDDNKTSIIPNQPHQKEQKLTMKVPESILKSSEAREGHLEKAFGNQDLDSVFQSARGASAQKKVDFDISQSEKTQSELTQSVYDSQMHNSQGLNRTNNYQLHFDSQTTSILHDSKIKDNKVLSKFLVRHDGHSYLQESIDFEAKSLLMDKMLIEFPVFALNEDYMKALALIIQNKLDQIKNIIANKQSEIQQLHEINQYNQQKQDSSAITERNARNGTNRVDPRQLDAFEEQLRDHQIVEDQMHVDQWIQKQQRRHAQLEALKHLSLAIQRTLIRKTVMEGFVRVATHSNTLFDKERRVAHRVQRRIRSKIFFRWFDGYFTQLEVTYLNYTKTLKRKVVRALHFERRKTHLKRSKAIMKFNQNLMFKVWLALLRNLNEIREEKHHVQMVQKSAHEKHHVDKGILVNPVLDKILPDERMEFYGRRSDENHEQSPTLQTCIDENSSMMNSQPIADKQRQRAGAPRASSNQITTKKTPGYGLRTSVGNPFKTLDTQYNTQSEQVLINRSETSGLDQYTPLRYDAGGRKIQTQDRHLDSSDKRALSSKKSQNEYDDAVANARLQEPPAMNQDVQPIIKRRDASRNDRQSDHNAKLFSFDGGQDGASTRLLSQESANNRRIEQQEQLNPNTQLAHAATDSHSPGYGAGLGPLADADRERALTPGFSGKKDLASGPRYHPDYLAYQQRLDHQLDQKQELIQLNFGNKDNKTISTYFQNQIDFMAKKNREKNQLNRSQNFNMTSQPNLQAQASNQTLAPGENASATMMSHGGSFSRAAHQNAGQVPPRSGLPGLPPSASQKSGLQLQSTSRLKTRREEERNWPPLPADHQSTEGRSFARPSYDQVKDKSETSSCWPPAGGTVSQSQANLYTQPIHHQQPYLAAPPGQPSMSQTQQPESMPSLHEVKNRAPQPNVPTVQLHQPSQQSRDSFQNLMDRAQELQSLQSTIKNCSKIRTTSVKRPDSQRQGNKEDKMIEQNNGYQRSTVAFLKKYV